MVQCNYTNNGKNLQYSFSDKKEMSNTLDGFVTFSLVYNQKKPLHENFKELSLYENKGLTAKLHLSILEIKIEEAWNLINSILLGAELTSFKIVRPGVLLSEESKPNASFARKGLQKSMVDFIFEVISDDKIEITGGKLNNGQVFSISFKFLENEGLIEKEILPKATDDNLHESIQHVILKILSDNELFKNPDDQSGKDLTIYVKSNLDKSREFWSDLIANIANTLIQNKIPPGYKTTSYGERADKHIVGMEYFSFRYENINDNYTHCMIKLQDIDNIKNERGFYVYHDNNSNKTYALVVYGYNQNKNETICLTDLGSTNLTPDTINLLKSLKESGPPKEDQNKKSILPEDLVNLIKSQCKNFTDEYDPIGLREILADSTKKIKQLHSTSKALESRPWHNNSNVFKRKIKIDDNNELHLFTLPKLSTDSLNDSSTDSSSDSSTDSSSDSDNSGSSEILDKPKEPTGIVSRHKPTPNEKPLKVPTLNFKKD